MKRAIYIFLLSILFLNPKIGFAQYITGIETIIENEVYVLHSELHLNSNIFNTSNIFLFKGINDTIWIFGTGYGEATDIQFYRNNPSLTTSGVANDASAIESVIQNNFGISNVNAKLQFIVPHFHLDHINQELITELEIAKNYNLTNSSIYVHLNDSSGSTCNSPCCGNIICNPGSPNFAAPYNFPWNTSTLSKFVSIGQITDNCNQILMSFSTSYGFWEITKADNQHTNGSLNIINTDHKLKILGAHLGTECTTPNDWQLIEPHGNLNIDSVITLSTDNFLADLSTKLKIYPNPTDNIATIEVLNSNSYINGKILIYNTIGKKVVQTDLISNKMNINLKLQSGVYFIQIIDNKGYKIAFEKLIIK